jgi:uncharacterized protein YbaR (Trm112 family)
MIDDQLLELLACPRCETRPPVSSKENMLICKECGYGYRVIDDIPRMLPEDALTPDEVDKELHGGS